MFIKWIRSTNASHQPKQIPMTSDMGLDLPEPAEDENEIT